MRYEIEYRVAWAPIGLRLVFTLAVLGAFAIYLFLIVPGVGAFVTGAVVVALSLWAWRLIRGDVVKLTRSQLEVPLAKGAASIPYSTISRVRRKGNQIEIEVAEEANWWKRFNFPWGARKFRLEEAADFLNQIEFRLGDTRRVTLSDQEEMVQRTRY